MNVPDLLIRLEAIGVIATMDEEGLAVRPASALDEELKEAINEHLALLSELATRAQASGRPGDLIGNATPVELGFPPTEEDLALAAKLSGPAAALGVEFHLATRWGPVVLTGSDMDRLAAVSRVFPQARLEGLRFRYLAANGIPASQAGEMASVGSLR